MQTSTKFCSAVLCKPAQSFVYLKSLSFVHKIFPRYLSVVQVILSFAAPPVFVVLPICECK